MAGIPIGVDIEEIKGIEQAVARWHDSFLRRVYTQAELGDCQDDVSRLAVRFAAKEAVMKALGTGTRGINWKEIEVYLDTNLAPHIRLYDRAYERSKELGLTEFSVSLSHSENYAVAFVIGNGRSTSP